GYLTVESARAEQGRIEHVRAVGRGQHDDVLVALEAVHLDQDLVEGLLALVVRASTVACAALAPDSVNLVDKNDARGLLFGLLEEIAHATGADAHEHLDELGA